MSERRESTILVVDDNPANLGLLTGYLQESGFEILVARSGRSALEKAAFSQPDLILLDVMLPDIDGFEVCRILKEQKTTRDIPVIFMTALVEVYHKVQGFEAGAVDYLTKPLQQAEVLARVNTHLRLHHLTHRLEMEVEARTEQIAKQASLLDKVSDAIISTSEDLVIESWNQAATRIYGWTAEEAIGQNAAVLLRTIYAVKPSEVMYAQLHEQGQYSGELVHHHKEGREIPIWANMTLMVNNGKTSIVTVNRDISAQKEAEAQRVELVKAAERADVLKNFIASISHDLKTPLASIEINLYMLERLTSPEKQHDKIEAIKVHTNHIQKLIENLLTVSRLDHVPEVTFEAVDVNRVLRAVETTLQTAVQSKNQRLMFALQERSVIEANEEELFRALVNVVENAVHYSPRSSVIRVITSATPDRLMIEVKDNGIGIDEADIPHIFERFYRADRRRDANRDGSGLGLTIVKRVMDLHHGQIEVESKRDHGTTFRLCLPFKQPVYD